MSQKKSQYSKEQLQTAKELYMAYKPRKEISSQSGISDSSLKYYISNYWYRERKLLKTELLQDLTENKRDALDRIVSNGLDVLANSIVAWRQHGVVLEPAQASALSKIITDVDKILNQDRINENNAEEDLRTASKEEVLEIISTDPLYVPENKGN